jgi:hypothetical protein
MNTPPPIPEAPKKSISSFDTWSEDLQNRKESLISQIHGDTVQDMHTFNHSFTKLVLNSPPSEDDVKVDRVPGQGEVQHIPLNILQLTADEIFQGNWGISSCNFTTAEKKTKNGLIPFVICQLGIYVVYPVTGLRREFVGVSDSNMTQTTASEALMSFALKNALGKIGKRFGNRYIYAKLDRGYSEDKPVSAADEAAAVTGQSVPSAEPVPPAASSQSAHSSSPGAPTTPPPPPFMS